MKHKEKLMLSKQALIIPLRKLKYGKIIRKKLRVGKHTALKKTKISKQYMIMHLNQ
jgi:bifunctional N-acetylglucosamine-1-phosphate-uridyltransferase/glucosamine-1-phosphate-acetyltransferase GlmU-like protein